MTGVLYNTEFDKVWIIKFDYNVGYPDSYDIVQKDIKVHPEDQDEICIRNVSSGLTVEFDIVEELYYSHKFGDSKLYGKIIWPKRNSLSEVIKTKEQEDQFMDLLNLPEIKKDNETLRKENSDLKLANEVMVNHISWLHKIGKIDTSRLQEDPIERLRNKLQPFISLPEFIKMGADDELINQQVELCLSFIQDIKKYLSDAELLLKP